VEEFAFEIRDGRGLYLVEVHDDGRTCYAYLYGGGKIVGDVWLYNVAEAPSTAPWERPGAGPDDAPFENPNDLVAESLERPRIDADGTNLDCEWYWSDFDLRYVDVKIDGITWGRLAPGSLPGWSRLAREDGPVARVLTD
jgi:hypothetical protein